MIRGLGYSAALQGMRLARLGAAGAIVTMLVSACGGMAPAGNGASSNASPEQRRYLASADQYKASVDQAVLDHNPGAVSRSLQPMLRSVVVVSFTVDREGRVVHASVYRTNGDDEVEARALSSLRRSAPLPPPPADLLDRNGRVDLMESWLFNTDGRFQLRSLASEQ